jgi:S1-C subfamily serine protease
MVAATFLLAVLLPAADPAARKREAAIAATVKLSLPGSGPVGSGVVVGRSGPHVYILTADHVVARARQLDLHVAAAGKSEVHKGAVVLARDAEADLAVLRLRWAPGLPKPLPLATPKQWPTAPLRAVSVGWATGNAPTALDEQVGKKVLLRRPGQKTSTWTWQTKRKQERGRSGGPLLDSAGRVIGLASGHDGTSGYYAHAEAIHRFLKRNGLGFLAEETGR